MYDSGKVWAYIVMPILQYSTSVLERVIQYLHYKDKYQSLKVIPDFKMEPEEILDVLVASNFLDC